MHEFRLDPPAPFNFEATAAFLSPGADEIVDVFDGKRLTRLVDVNGRMRLVLVSSLGRNQRPELIVTLMNGTERDEPGVVSLLARMLGMGYELQPFYRMCRQDQGLYGLSSDYYGLKPPQRMHPFEAIALAKEFEVTTEDTDARFAEMAEAQGMDVKQLKEMAEAQGWNEAIKSELLDKKALDFLVSQATVEELVEEVAPEAPQVEGAVEEPVEE